MPGRPALRAAHRGGRHRPDRHLRAKNGWIGQFLEPLGIQVAFKPLGVLVALVFIGLPFVVRTVQPILEDLDTELEEAAASLGASAGRPSATSSCRSVPGAADRLSRWPSRAAWGNTARSSSSPATSRWCPRSRR
jgi:hypothetical protein